MPQNAAPNTVEERLDATGRTLEGLPSTTEPVLGQPSRATGKRSDLTNSTHNTNSPSISTTEARDHPAVRQRLVSLRRRARKFRTERNRRAAQVGHLLSCARIVRLSSIDFHIDTVGTLLNTIADLVGAIYRERPGLIDHDQLVLLFDDANADMALLEEQLAELERGLKGLNGKTR